MAAVYTRTALKLKKRKMFLFSLAAFIVVSFFLHVSAYVGLRLVVCSASSISLTKVNFFFHCHHPKISDSFSMPCSEGNVAGVCNITALAILPNSVAFLSRISFTVIALFGAKQLAQFDWILGKLALNYETFCL